MASRTSSQIDSLMRAGQWARAEVACRQALHQAPDNGGLLVALSHCQLRLGQKSASLDSARQALAQAIPKPAQAIELAQICFHAGSITDARKALERALDGQPADARLHLQYGHLLRECGEEDPALVHFACALKLERGARGQIPNEPAFTTAAAALDRHFWSLNRRLLDTPEFEDMAPEARQRLSDFVDSTLGVKEKHYQDPIQRPSLHYLADPRPKPFYERDEFDWVPALESRWRDIRDELQQVLQGDEGFAPYVDHSGRKDNWSKLQGQRTWSAFHLFRNGRAVEENHARCPKTAEILKGLPLASAPEHAPEAFFSVIKPGTEIAPHFGLSNTKLAVHLALIIPPNCGLRAGPETRHWREGECLIFDDSYEHEAWNRSEHTRAVLIFDVWNPKLSPLDIEVVQGMCGLTRGWFTYARDLDPANPASLYKGQDVFDG